MCHGARTHVTVELEAQVVHRERRQRRVDSKHHESHYEYKDSRSTLQDPP